MPITGDLKSLFDRLKKHPMLSPRHCDSCGHAHAPDDLKLVSTGEDGLVFQLSCTSCGLIQMFKLTPGGPVAIQRFEANNSEVTGQELKKFAGRPTVNKDEALDVYEDMQQVESIDDFLQLVEKKSSVSTDSLTD